MAMLTELFGEEILSVGLEEVKEKIRGLPPAQQERRSYLLHEWSVIKGIKLSKDDFANVE